MPCQQMTFYLGDSVYTDANDDQKRRSPKIERNIQLVDQDFRQDANDGDVNGSTERYPREYPVDILGCTSSRPYPRNESAIFLHVIRNLSRIKMNGRIEITEENDKTYVE